MKKKSKSSHVAVITTTVIMFVGIAAGADVLFKACFPEQKKEKAVEARNDTLDTIKRNVIDTCMVNKR
ncbi:MAG: hypothetical protein J6R22_04880 [Alphaproteobacteria bacterium]|nr:hypothetical protein [Alphaproteobacteria bacterium]